MVVAVLTTGSHASEIRGTLVEQIRIPRLVIKDDQGHVHEFRAYRPPHTLYLEGTRRQLPTNDTWLNLDHEHGVIDPLIVHHDAGRLGYTNLIAQGFTSQVAAPTSYPLGPISQVLVSTGVAQLDPLALQVVVDWSWYQFPGMWIEEKAAEVSQASERRFGPDAFLSRRENILALLGVTLVSLVCGMVSSLVVSNRMAFFSDALAHCAFAGIGLGLLLHLAGLIVEDSIVFLMILFGMLVGVLIAFVKEHSSLANDTVIGVFFAGAIGFGAVLLKGISSHSSRLNPENFLFGSPLGVNGPDLVHLFGLLVITLGFLFWLYNRLVFISFNPSLARSRNFPVRAGNYLFIVLLAMIVNICLKLVGALLINALLILPAASSGNICRNLRQFFWISTLLSLVSGVLGLWLSDGMVISLDGPPPRTIHMGTGGMIVVVSVLIFFFSMFLGRWLRGARAALRTSY
jgi:zinc transport system permease protein